MGESLKLLFSDCVTLKPLFVIKTPKAIPEAGRKTTRENMQFEWLAAVSAEAIEKQREAGVVITQREPEVSVTVIHIQTPKLFLDWINHTNSREWDADKIKRIDYHLRTGNLKALRRLLKDVGVVYTAED